MEQGVELVVIKKLLGHAHISVTATVYTHVRLRLQRDAIDTLSIPLDGPAGHEPTRNDGKVPSPCASRVRWRCRQLLPSPRAETAPGHEVG
nr:hypothetical protein [Wenjunlia vitaminophila]